jgi:REP element-mobilizing transposase RayT
VETERRALKNPTPHFSSDHRRAVQDAIREVSRHRKWSLHAANVRTNHVHVVISADRPPEFVMNSLKSWATRKLRDAGLAGSDQKVWARHGSTRYLWSEQDVVDAVAYVMDGQGPALP